MEKNKKSREKEISSIIWQTKKKIYNNKNISGWFYSLIHIKMKTTLAKVLGLTTTLVLGVACLQAFANTYVVYEAKELNSANLETEYGCTTEFYDNFCDLSNKGITSIAPDTFANYGQLTYLLLKGNHLTSLESGVFDGLTGLRVLDMEDNQLTSLEPGVFDYLSWLSVLYMGNNQLTSLGSGILNWLSSLEELHFNGNQIASIESGAFDGLSSLVALDMGNNHLTWLENNLFNGLSSLGYLAMNGNKIASIEQGTFDGLATLKNLQLNNNQLTSLESGVFNGLSWLKLLDLYYNNFSSLEKDMFNGLSSLDDLESYGNQITTLTPGTFAGMPTLKVLGLDGNQLTSLKDGVFDGLTWLTALSISSNWLSSIESGTFDGLSSLQLIDINNNHLTSLTPGTFAGLSSLHYLDMSVNQLTSLENGLFDNTSLLKTLNISSNPIVSIGDTVFNTLNTGVNVQSDSVCNDAVFSWGWRSYQMNTNYCALLNSADSATFANELHQKWYTNSWSLLDLGASYYIGNAALDFFSWTTHAMPQNIVMESVNQSMYPNYSGDYQQYVAEVQYDSWTEITQNGQSFVGVLHGPELFPYADIPWMMSGIALMRFGALNQTIDFSQSVTIRMPAPGKIAWDSIDIYNSPDETIYGTSWANWQLVSTGTVISIAGNPYVQFTTLHAGRYALVESPIVESSSVRAQVNIVTYDQTTGNTNDTPTSNGQTSTTISNSNWGGSNGNNRVSTTDNLTQPITQQLPLHFAAETQSGSVLGSSLAPELNNAYLWAYEYQITTIPTIQNVNITGVLLRKDMAKMIANFAVHVLKKQIGTGTTKCSFSDMREETTETQNYAISACRLGLMWYTSNGMTIKKTFDANQSVDRAQFGTILSRLLRGTKNNGWIKYYEKHLATLKSAGIMTKIDTPAQKEMRGRVMVMMQRAALIK